MKTNILIGGLSYQITDDGKIDKRRGSGYLKTWPDKDGYHKISITTKNGTVNAMLHRVVWEAFNEAIPDRMTVDHIDEDKNNNRLSNLQLLSSTDNAIKGNAVNWIVTDPQGNEEIIYNLRQFCRQKNLHMPHISTTSYKKWKARKHVDAN